eukprot:jgi/Picsp_1/2933/NSC_01158-R1_duf563 domain-containing protein
MQHAPTNSTNGNHIHRNCKYLYGVEHIVAYRDQTELCSGGRSTVKCSRFEDTHPESGEDEFGEALCEAINITIDYNHLSRWSDEKEEKFLDIKKQSKDIGTDWWATESLAGALRGSCNEAEYRVKNWTTGHGGQAFLRHSFVSEPVDRTAPAERVLDEQQECKFGGGLKHTLYVIGDKWSVEDNLWHNIEEIMSMFVAYAVFELRPEDTQVVLAGAGSSVPASSSFSMFQEVAEAFSGAYPVESLEDAIKRVAGNAADGRVCLPRIIFSTWGHPSIQAAGSYFNMQRMDLSAPYECSTSPILLGMRDFIVSRVLSSSESSIVARRDGQSMLHGLANEKTIRVLWPVRKTRLTGLEDVMLDIIRRVCREKNAHLIEQDLSHMSFSEQLGIIRSTNVLVGLHGAALTWAYFLPPNSSLIEISNEPASARCFCFQTAAKSVGVGYRFIQFGKDRATDDDRHQDDARLYKSVEAAIHKASNAKPYDSPLQGAFAQGLP